MIVHIKQNYIGSVQIYKKKIENKKNYVNLKVLLKVLFNEFDELIFFLYLI